MRRLAPIALLLLVGCGDTKPEKVTPDLRALARQQLSARLGGAAPLEVDAELPAPSLANEVIVTATDVRIGGAPLVLADDPDAAVAAIAARLKEATRPVSGKDDEPMRVLVAADARAGRVALVLRAVADVGFDHVELPAVARGGTGAIVIRGAASDAILAAPPATTMQALAPKLVAIP